MDAVVKVYAIHAEPNWSLPWQRKRQMPSTSTGFIVAGRRVLTNAHSVEFATVIKLKHRGADTKYVARVLSIGTECDLALLAVDDDQFWVGIEPIVLGNTPRLQDDCVVVGYPLGGDSLSITAGVVSRVECVPYVHSSAELICVQIDAAINPGNSGGPVFNSAGLCVGIAHQTLRGGSSPDGADAEGIGYIIPPPIVEHFLHDFDRTGGFSGFPALGVEWQRLESQALRKSIGLSAAEKGILTRRVEPCSPAFSVLRKGDVLLAFDGHAIASDGTVVFRKGERISFSHLVTQKSVGETAELRIFRAPEGTRTVTVALAAPKRLIPVHTCQKPPSYYIIAGLVFVVVSQPYLRSEYGQHYEYDSPVRLLDRMLYGQATTSDEEHVVLGQVLSAEINAGYEDVTNSTVIAVNGVRIRNLRHLAETVEAATTQFLRLDLDLEGVLVLETTEARKATPDILATHSIPNAASADLLDALRTAAPRGAKRKGQAKDVAAEAVEVEAPRRRR